MQPRKEKGCDSARRAGDERGPVVSLKKDAKAGVSCANCAGLFLSSLCQKDPTMLTLNSIVQRDPEVIAAEADLDLVMVSIATGSYYGLSDVAREIWDAIEQPKRISDLVNDLTARYQIDSVSCEEQTLSFLNALLNEGLLRVENGSAG
jgi:hypothetical protein